jgi:hypothetical protein
VGLSAWPARFVAAEQQLQDSLSTLLSFPCLACCKLEVCLALAFCTVLTQLFCLVALCHAVLCRAGSDSAQRNHSPEQPGSDLLYQQGSAAAANGTFSHSHEQLSDSDDQQQQDAVSIPNQQAAGKGTAASREAAAAAAAAAHVVDDASENEDGEEQEEEEGAAAGGDGEAKKAKKRRGQKKKKKKKKGAAAAEVEQDGISAEAANSGSTAAVKVQSLKEDEDTDVFFDAPESISDNDDSSQSSTTLQQLQDGMRATDAPAAGAAGVRAGRPAEIDAAAGPAVPDLFNSENYMDFFTEEPQAGTTHLPSQVCSSDALLDSCCCCVPCFAAVHLCILAQDFGTMPAASH